APPIPRHRPRPHRAVRRPRRPGRRPAGVEADLRQPAARQHRDRCEGQERLARAPGPLEPGTELPPRAGQPLRDRGQDRSQRGDLEHDPRPVGRDGRPRRRRGGVREGRRRDAHRPRCRQLQRAGVARLPGDRAELVRLAVLRHPRQRERRRRRGLGHAAVELARGRPRDGVARAARRLVHGDRVQRDGRADARSRRGQLPVRGDEPL
ncbi:MAG: hypothetical protein AVDCRST_MAG30-1045, partial [uncultured Solirubrobacteraceae bacterium]